MSWPPIFVQFERGALRLWLPVFLLWPLLLIGLAFTVIAAGAALLVLQPRSLPLAGDVGLNLARIFWSARGTRVEVGFDEPLVVTVH